MVSWDFPFKICLSVRATCSVYLIIIGVISQRYQVKIAYCEAPVFFPHSYRWSFICLYNKQVLAGDHLQSRGILESGWYNNREISWIPVPCRTRTFPEYRFCRNMRSSWIRVSREQLHFLNTFRSEVPWVQFYTRRRNSFENFGSIGFNMSCSNLLARRRKRVKL